MNTSQPATPGLTQALAEMPAVFAPAAVSWWPPASGWWIVCAVLIIGMVLLVKKVFQRAREMKPLRVGLRELERVSNATELSNHQKLVQLSMILRQVTNDYLQNSHYATLSGPRWLESLDSLNQRPSKNLQSNANTFEKLYSNAEITSNEINQVIDNCKNWLKTLRKNNSQSSNEANSQSQTGASSIMLDKEGRY